MKQTTHINLISIQFSIQNNLYCFDNIQIIKFSAKHSFTKRIQITQNNFIYEIFEHRFTEFNAKLSNFQHRSYVKFHIVRIRLSFEFCD